MPPPRREYLLMPVPPTPNGRLHLGHIAGPYLRMDVAARALRRRGDLAHVITGTDSHDSYVLWKARQLGITPGEVCDTFHALIERDLRALDIDVAAFVDIRTGRGREAHARHTRGALQSLLDRGEAVHVTEQVLYQRRQERFVVGCWLTGRCPLCRAPCAGYFCEACGGHFRPEEVLDAADRLGSADLCKVKVESLFLKVGDRQRLFEAYDQRGVPQAVQAICRANLDAQGDRFRLTVPGAWGIPWSPDASGLPRSIFQAGWEFLTYGEVYAHLTGAGESALSPSSDVCCVASFGIDNTIPLLVGGIAGPLALGAARPVDHVLINHFYRLEGEKFSTSRNHVLWAGDVATLADGAGDALRYYLCRTSGEGESANFSLAQFVDTVNRRLRCTLWSCVSAAADSLAGQDTDQALDDALSQRLAQSLERQDAALDFRDFSLGRAVAELDDWIELATRTTAPAPQTAYWWLKGLALLSAPVMPRLAGSLWCLLGHRAAPAVCALGEIAPLPQARVRMRNPFGALSSDALVACVGGKVRSAEEIK